MSSELSRVNDKVNRIEELIHQFITTVNNKKVNKKILQQLVTYLNDREKYGYNSTVCIWIGEGKIKMNILITKCSGNWITNIYWQDIIIEK